MPAAGGACWPLPGRRPDIRPGAGQLADQRGRLRGGRGLGQRAGWGHQVDRAQRDRRRDGRAGADHPDLAERQPVTSIASRLAVSPRERLTLALNVPVVYKVGEVAVLGQTKQARIAGFGDLSLEARTGWGPSARTR